MLYGTHQSSDRFQIKALEFPRLQSLPHFSRLPTITKLCLKKFQVSFLFTVLPQLLCSTYAPWKTLEQVSHLCLDQHHMVLCSCSGYQLQSATHLHSNSNHRLMGSCSWHLFYCQISVQKCTSECRWEGRSTGDSKPATQINYLFDI